MRYKISAAAGVLLLLAGSAHANMVSGLNPDLSSRLASVAAPGADYTGAAEWIELGDEDSGDGDVRALLSDRVVFGDGASGQDALATAVTPGRSQEVLAARDADAEAINALASRSLLESLSGSAPEPEAMFLVGIALVAFSLLGAKRGRTKRGNRDR